MREDVHRFANVSEVQAVYDVLERPRTIRDIVTITGYSPGQCISAVKALEYKKKITSGGIKTRLYQWRR